MDDRRWIRRCLALAARAAGRTSPNPMVGCVVVDRRGHVLAEGWHRRAGEPHAEADALSKLGGEARGATLYVNLEPCAHTSGRRTAPCAPLVRDSGVARVVIGMRDPFPGHGGGVELLRNGGVRVDGPVEERACRRLNEAFVVHATEKRAHVTLKAAMTLDGKIATRAGESRWITGLESRALVHRLRDRIDAVLVGAGTVIADDPLLTTRDVPRGRDPVRVILDGRLRTPQTARLFGGGTTIVATTRDAPDRRARALERAGGEILRLPGKNGIVDLHALVRTLAERDLISLLVEGGSITHAAFMEAELCDRLLLFVAPKAVGGPAPSWLGGDGVARLADAHRFAPDAPPRRLGDDLLLDLVRVPAAH